MSKKIKCANPLCHTPVHIGTETIHNGQIYCCRACAQNTPAREDGGETSWRPGNPEVLLK